MVGSSRSSESRRALQRLDEPELLLRAVGVRAHVARELFSRQAETGEQRLARGRRPARETGEGVERLAAGEPGPEHDVAREEADVAPPRDVAGRQPAAEHGDLAAVGPEQSEQEPDGGRLPRAVGAEEAEDLAVLDP